MYSNKEVLVITTNQPSEGKIIKHLKPVTAHVVAGTNLFSDFFASMSDIFGGRSGSYQKQLSSIYSEAIENIKKEAERIGANGVVGLKIDIDEISGGGKSMFMITAIGTAVIIEKEEKSSTILKDRPKDHSRVYNEQVHGLKQLKNIIEKAEKDNLEFNNEVWKVIIQNKVTELYPTVISLLSKVLDRGYHYTEETRATFVENSKIYIKSLELEDKVELIYESLKNTDISKEVVDFLLEVINEELLLDFERVSSLLQHESLAVKKRGLKISIEDLPYYTQSDERHYNSLCELIKTTFVQRGVKTTKKQMLSSKEKEAWECECGKINDVDITYCTRCSNDIYGFNDSELKPKEALMRIDKKISLFMESLNNQTVGS